MLKVQNISKILDNFKLEDINIELEEGFIMGLIGPNGSGKTTLIKIIMGLMDADEGDIKIFGKNIDEEPVYIKNNIGFVYDTLDFYPNLKVKEFKNIMASFYENYDEIKFNNYLQRFGISEKARIRNLSKGESVKLMLANALSHNAKLLILDEPTAGLDPVVRRDVLTCLQEFIENGDSSVIISTHNTDELDKIADYVTFINKGQQVFTMDKESMLENYRLIRCHKNDLEKIKEYVVGENHNKYYSEALLKVDDDKVKENLTSIFEDSISSPTIEDMMYYYIRGGK